MKQDKSTKLQTLNNNPFEDPNNTYKILHNVIQDAKETHMPSKVIKFNKYKHKKSKWISAGLIKSIKYRDNLYKKTKNNRS